MGWVIGLQDVPEGTLLQNVNMQMAREEYELNGQQGLDELLSVFAGDEIQVCALWPTLACYACPPPIILQR